MYAAYSELNSSYKGGNLKFEIGPFRAVRSNFELKIVT